MNIPWFRLVCMFVFMRKGDAPEEQLAHVAHFALSWGLTEAVTPLGRRAVLTAQARRQEITHDHARTVRLRTRARAAQHSAAHSSRCKP
jgi:hypothetical protein